MNIWDPIWTDKVEEIEKFQPFLVTFDNITSYLPNIGRLIVNSFDVKLKIRFTETFINKNFSKNALYVMDDGRCNLSIKPQWVSGTFGDDNKKRRRSIWNIIVKDNGFDLIPDLTNVYWQQPTRAESGLNASSQEIQFDFGAIVIWLQRNVTLTPQDVKCQLALKITKSPIYVAASGYPTKKQIEGERAPYLSTYDGTRTWLDTTDVTPVISSLNNLQFNSDTIILQHIQLKSSNEIRSIIHSFSSVPVTTREKTIRARKEKDELVLKVARPTTTASADSTIDQKIDQTQSFERTSIARRVVNKLMKLLRRKR